MILTAITNDEIIYCQFVSRELKKLLLLFGLTELEKGHIHQFYTLTLNWNSKILISIYTLFIT